MVNEDPSRGASKDETKHVADPKSVKVPWNNTSVNNTSTKSTARRGNPPRPQTSSGVRTRSDNGTGHKGRSAELWWGAQEISRSLRARFLSHYLASDILP
ncbi:hypothetical protein ABVK25_001745 [Lepraria finkii]|uniref:Uncharacterized protein n=1 Tax=Lepraria finkii TaxID=1340010 RepID=A0ABR4BL51_9LECA